MYNSWGIARGSMMHASMQDIRISKTPAGGNVPIALANFKRLSAPILNLVKSTSTKSIKSIKSTNSTLHREKQVISMYLFHQVWPHSSYNTRLRSFQASNLCLHFTCRVYTEMEQADKPHSFCQDIEVGCL